LTDGIERPLFVFHPWQLNQDGVRTRDRDLRLLNASHVLDSPSHDLDGLLEDLRIGAGGGGEDHRSPAREIETQLRQDSLSKDRRHAAPGQHQNDAKTNQAPAQLLGLVGDPVGDGPTDDSQPALLHLDYDRIVVERPDDTLDPADGLDSIT
jgi:hypothetical protein